MSMFSKKIKECREKCGLTQKQMAQALNLERSTYTYYEIGKSQPNLETLKSIAQIFHVSVDDLLGYKPQPHMVRNSKLTNHRTQYLSNVTALQNEEQNLILLFRQMNEEQKADIIKMMSEKTMERKYR